LKKTTQTDRESTCCKAKAKKQKCQLKKRFPFPRFNSRFAITSEHGEKISIKMLDRRLAEVLAREIHAIRHTLQ